MLGETEENQPVRIGEKIGTWEALQNGETQICRFVIGLFDDIFTCVGYLASDGRMTVNYDLDGRGHYMI